MMAQEEHSQKNSNSSSSGGGEVESFKKMKQKKVPQRGLGVAQLEKIRLEEQQKKQAALQQAATSNVLTPNPIKSPTDSSSGLVVQCPNFRPSISSSTSVPPLLPQADLLSSSNDTMFRPPPTPTPTPSIPNVELLHAKPVPLSKPLNVSGVEIGWSAHAPPPAPIPAAWSKVWNGEHNLEGENQRLDHYGFRYRPNVNMAHESTTPFVPLPNFMERPSQIQQPSPSSMVNLSTGISSSPVMNFQMEPPSNQNIPANHNYPPLWPDEEKMIGMKRPYPFSIETPPAPALHFKCHSTYLAPPSRLDEAASCSNRNYVSSNRGFAVIRECPARPNTMSEPSKVELGDRERGGGLNGDFLTLAPPTSSSQHLNLKHKQALVNSGIHSWELSEYHHPHPSRQGNTEDAAQGQGSSKPIHQPALFCFFPLSKKQQQQIGQSSTTLLNNHNCSSSTDVGENIDLSLKL